MNIDLKEEIRKLNTQLLDLQNFKVDAEELISKEKEKYEKELKVKVFEKDEEIKQLKEQKIDLENKIQDAKTFD